MDEDTAKKILENCKEIIAYTQISGDRSGMQISGALVDWEMLAVIADISRLIESGTDPKTFPEPIKRGLRDLARVAGAVRSGGLHERARPGLFQRLRMTKMQRIGEQLKDHERQETLKHKEVIDDLMARGDEGRKIAQHISVVVAGCLIGRL